MLDWFGFDAVYSPNGCIYVAPDVLAAIYSGGGRSWLIEHEKAHAYQCARDGWLCFWVGICWAFVKYGHAASPYEIEANDIADMAVGW